ncbi:putative glycolipid-binding domain-containing protein [Amycolatopsis sp. NPDC059027]|uniref:putative glycolipid-binding domain-containing protein n=1 Tax=Amycolatopsis sp. NPDC059027 TaxID=3346709 RepID=UPI00366A8D88
MSPIFAELPATAAWAHESVRSGFEVVYFSRSGNGFRAAGMTTAVEDGRTWSVDYDITLDETWATRRALVTGRSAAGVRTALLESDGEGRWFVDGEPAPRLDGCFDVDLEASAMTNAFPVHRLKLAPAARSAAPAAYVRALDLTVDRLEQEYTRTTDGEQRYAYAAPAFAFACELSYDDSGLVVSYPGIATRVV